jgi:hypothetical protein
MPALKRSSSVGSCFRLSTPKGVSTGKRDKDSVGLGSHGGASPKLEVEQHVRVSWCAALGGSVQS